MVLDVPSVPGCWLWAALEVLVPFVLRRFRNPLVPAGVGRIPLTCLPELVLRDRSRILLSYPLVPPCGADLCSFAVPRNP